MKRYRFTITRTICADSQDEASGKLIASLEKGRASLWKCCKTMTKCSKCGEVKACEVMQNSEQVCNQCYKAIQEALTKYKPQ